MYFSDPFGLHAQFLKTLQKHKGEMGVLFPKMVPAGAGRPTACLERWKFQSPLPDFQGGERGRRLNHPRANDDDSAMKNPKGSFSAFLFRGLPGLRKQDTSTRCGASPKPPKDQRSSVWHLILCISSFAFIIYFNELVTKEVFLHVL